MFPAQCQRWVIGGAVSVKPALNKWDYPPHCRSVPFLGPQPSDWVLPQFSQVKTSGKYTPAS